MSTVGADEATGAGAITTDAGGRGRGVRGGVIERRTEGLGAPPDPKPLSTAGGVMPVAAAGRWRVRLSMRREGGKTFRGDGLPGGEEADAARSVIKAEYSLCKVLIGREARWVAIAAATGGLCSAFVAP